MSTIEEFENAPVGATATNQDGEKAIKTSSRSTGNSLWLSEYMAFYKPVDLDKEGFILELLPDPKPDWLDAPAVMAECECSPGEQTVHVNYSEIAWTCTDCDNPINPEDMKNVTPLYPRGKKNE